MNDKAVKPQHITEGFKGFPDCEECQCYPECRIDCPDHRECLKRLPEYRGAVEGVE